MKDIKILGLPLPLYLVVLALTVACMAAGCIPNSLAERLSRSKTTNVDKVINCCRKSLFDVIIS